MDNQPNQSPKPQRLPRQRPRVVKFRFNPLYAIGGAILLFFLFTTFMSAGQTTQMISLDSFIRKFEAGQFSSIQIRDSGEVVAQDKYLNVIISQDVEVPKTTDSDKEFETVDIQDSSLDNLITALEPKTALEQVQALFGGEELPNYSELILGEDFILAVDDAAGASGAVIQGAGKDQFEKALADRGLKLVDLGIKVSPVSSAAEEVTQDSFQQRFKSDMYSYIFRYGDVVFARISDDKIASYSLKWDGGFNSFIDTLQQEGVSLTDNNSVIVTFPVATIPWGDIISILTLVGFVVLGFVLFRGLQSSGSGLMRFGQTKARMFWGVKPDITFKDVAGVDEAKEELNEIVMFLKSPNRFRKLGARIPKGVLMVGPPGTGKTLMARAIAGEAGVPFFHTSGSEFEEMLVGAGASRVRDLFEKAKKASPALIFIDEIDAVARKRGTTIQSSTTEQTLNQILVEMDGFEQNINVIVIAATNRPDVLDPAILRPGRFDRRVMLELPDATGRRKILDIHSANKPLSEKVDMDKVAKRTIGFSGAELENVMNEAAIIAAKRGDKEVQPNDIEEAASKVTMGPAKTSRKRDKYTLELVAYHEAGHAVVSKFVPQANPVHRVSIISRGGAGGVTEFLPVDENQITSKTKLLSQLVVAFGGRAAEEIFMKDISTGASGDITQATSVARNMVQKFGMSEKLGLIKYGDSDDLMHLGYGYGDSREYSEETAKLIDEEVRTLVADAYQRALDILKQHSDIVEKLKDMLLDKEVVESDEFDHMFEGVKGANKPVESRRLVEDKPQPKEEVE